MRAILATFIAVAVWVGAPAQAAAPVEAGKVFSGPEGEQVAVIPLTPVEDKKALLYVQGTGSELDGKVLLHEVNARGDSVDYTTQRRGRSYATLVVRLSGGRRSYLLHAPDRRDGIGVSFDDTRTKALKAGEVYALHQKQQADGSLTRFMAFDRKAESAQAEQGLSEVVKSLDEACGTSVVATVDWDSVSDELLEKYSISSYCGAPLESLDEACGTSVVATVDWDSVSDELLEKYSISSYCGAPLEALGRLCGSPEAKKAIQAQVKALSCRFGDALKLELQAGRVTWTTAKDVANQEEFATKYFEANLESSRGQGETLAERMRLEKIRVCTDGKGHYVAVTPHDRQRVQLAYGDGSRFVQVASPPWVLSGYHFLEPRFFNKTMNPSFRGLDMRVYSEVMVDETQRTCAVRCGTRTSPFTLLESEQAQELVSKARFEPNPQKYVPYALLRDQQGRYYLVDRGFRPEDERSFRVFIGPKGNLQPQKMMDIVSDSEGEIFATKKGELRLVVDREAPSMWLEKKKKTELRAVPVSENLPLIYNELGVYTGARLGTPCDDL